MSRMLSATRFMRDFLKFLPLLIEHNAFMDIDYKGRVYRVHVDDMKQDAPRRSYQKKIKRRRLEIKFCSVCGGLLYEGQCIAPEKHPTN